MNRDTADRNNSVSLTVALISEVFFDDHAESRLRSALREAKDAGAELVVLPEIPLNPWAPATKNLRDEDAETMKGPRYQIQADAAADVGIGLLGGAIIKDSETGDRFNTSLLFSLKGALIGSFRKCHIPEEPGFWETSHYSAGSQPSEILDAFGIRFGIQICSDINRPQGALALAAAGAEAVINPRATEFATADRWRIVFTALAITSGAYILSVNRPAPEGGVLIGGPSVAVSPLGDVLIDSTDRISLVTLKRSVVEQARTKYPGYLPVRSDLYASAWGKIDPIPGYHTNWSTESV